MNKLQPRHYIYIILLLFIVLGYVGLFGLWRRQRSEIHTLNAELSQINSKQSDSQISSWDHVTISPSSKVVYLPLVSLELPISSLAESLVYSFPSLPSTVKFNGIGKTFPAVLNVSTQYLASNAFSTTDQYDCAQVVYANFETPSYPVNPQWKSDGQVKLNDGRTMTVYYAPHIPGCNNSLLRNNTDPKALADLLKQAASY